MRDTLISTVGTSLITNLKNSEDDGIKKYLETHNAQGLAVALLNFPPGDRICGAEINSIWSIVSGVLIQDRKRLIFLVSDTDEGRFTGDVLSKYYKSSKNSARFEEVETRVVEGLTANDVNRFRNEGLRNLVRRISEVVRKVGDSSRVLINATGGYKAQISFAGMIGQSLGIPVCYMYEGFSEVIQLPPQPISLDLSFWLKYNDLFYDLEAGIEGPFVMPDEKFASLIDREEVDGEILTTLSATGQLFHETFSHHFGQREKEILPLPSSIPVAEKKIRYEDQNAGKHTGLAHFLEKVRTVPYVSEIYTFYFNPDLNIPTRFRKSAKGAVDQVEGHFSGNGATTKFIVLTTAKAEEENRACIADLNIRYHSGLL